METLRTIAGIEPKPGFRLEIAWTGGGRSTVDLAQSIASGGVFAPLQDQALFEQVRVGARKRTVEWPQPVDGEGAPAIDIDADALSALSAPGQPASASDGARQPARRG